MSNGTEITDEDTKHNHSHGRPARRSTHFAAFGVAAFTALVIGAAGGAFAMKYTRPSIELAPLTPVAISSLKEDRSTITVKGKVAEIFGNKFIVQDESGRALIETGPAGDGGKLVAANETVSVQGRFDDGFMHASFIVHEDGKTEVLRPAGPPRHGGPLEDAMRRLKP
jgi:uncharacterized protein YdeI (BOF family)